MALGLSGATDYCVLWCGGVDFGEGGTVGGGGFNSTLDERFGTVDVGTGGMVYEPEGFAAGALHTVIPKDAGDALLVEAADEVFDVVLLEGGGLLGVAVGGTAFTDVNGNATVYKGLAEHLGSGLERCLAVPCCGNGGGVPPFIVFRLNGIVRRVVAVYADDEASLGGVVGRPASGWCSLRRRFVPHRQTPEAIR